MTEEEKIELVLGDTVQAEIDAGTDHNNIRDVVYKFILKRLYPGQRELTPEQQESIKVHLRQNGVEV
jgi:hypothetical protein